MIKHFPSEPRVDAPVCSVCIANYNGIDLLASCIDSVLAQSIDFAIEIIVHDDASADGSVTFLRQHYPQVELLVSGENVGFCIGNNRMAAHARGEFLLLLNNDAALHPDALRDLLAAARTQRQCGILTLPQYDWFSGALFDRGCLLDPFYNPVPNMDAARSGVAYVIGACLWIPRAVWVELNGFPEWMGSIGEDVYLGCIARLRGYEVMVLSTSGYRHRQGATFGGNPASAKTLQTTFRRRFLSESNKTMALIVCTPTVLMWPLLFLHLTLLTLEGVLWSLLRRDARVWREIYAAAIAKAWATRELLSATRTRVQAARRITIGQYFATFTFWPRKLVLLLRHGWPRIKS